MENNMLMCLFAWIVIS